MAQPAQKMMSRAVPVTVPLVSHITSVIGCQKVKISTSARLDSETYELRSTDFGATFVHTRLKAGRAITAIPYRNANVRPVKGYPFCGYNVVAIEPQVFNLLLLLINNRDCVVSGDELIDSVWNGGIVSEATLSSRIFALRQVLGDTGEAQKIIQTVRRRGFRFLAAITSDMAAEGQTAHGVNPAAPSNEATRQATTLPTLAVLPFKIASDGLDEYFCDGLT